MDISIGTKTSSELLFAEAGLYPKEKPKTEKKKETDKKCYYCFYCCFKKKSSNNTKNKPQAIE
jgi:hypothetical protein